ncbi:MAG: hypothetical protein JSW40_02195 [Candidatus Omnitrophota bacterium]|nr:MAG: hypothetical protein JSW40_02195 [Candidatus Omnitrophota bacterium]
MINYGKKNLLKVKDSIFIIVLYALVFYGIYYVLRCYFLCGVPGRVVDESGKILLNYVRNKGGVGIIIGLLYTATASLALIVSTTKYFIYVKYLVLAAAIYQLYCFVLLLNKSYFSLQDIIIPSIVIATFLLAHINHITPHRT